VDPIQTKSAQSFSVASVHINICNVKIWLNNTKKNLLCPFIYTIPPVLLRTLTLPEIKTCDLTEELRRVIEICCGFTQALQ